MLFKHFLLLFYCFDIIVLMDLFINSGNEKHEKYLNCILMNRKQNNPVFVFEINKKHKNTPRVKNTFL